MRVATSETGAAWKEFFSDLLARGLNGVRLVTSDSHTGLVEAIAAHRRVLPGNAVALTTPPSLMSITPKTYWPAIKAMRHSVYEHPDAQATNTQFDRLVDYVQDKLPRSLNTWTLPGQTSWPLPISLPDCGPRSSQTTPTNGSTARYAAAPTAWHLP